MTPWHWHGDERLSVAELDALLADPPVPPDESWHPRLCALAPGETGDALRDTSERHGIRVVDPIDRQLEDLAAIRFPAARDAHQRAPFLEARARHLGDPAREGRWAWLPWLRCLVHVLDRDDFHDVITNRNQDKLTRAEQQALRARTVGIMGLSVGGEGAVAIAQEHLCGHLHLADFDRLDLSNLNRLGAGIDELAVNKAVIVARRIARIDPYLRLTLFPDGVTDGNQSRFLDGLDLLLEECDSLHLKFTIREEAKRRGLNILFAGDERGFLSVEPHATHPDLAPFHGRVTEAPRPRHAYASAPEFMRALAEWLGGWDALSARSRQSLPRIGEDLCGYPQLAGEAHFTAGQLAHMARRLLLGVPTVPGIHHVDLDEIWPH